MDLGLGGKVAIVTGSSRGIGRATALALADEGCAVVVTARGDEALRSTAREIEDRGGSVLAVRADVTAPADVQRLVEQAASTFGRIDVLVNNVGGSRGTNWLETQEEDFRQALDANLFPAIRASKIVVPHMQHQGSGAIINIASIYGKEAGGNIAYNASKAAEISLTKAMARDLAPFHIRVNCVAPGSILFPGGSWDRRMQADPEGIGDFARREMPSGFGTPEDVANVVVFLASERAGHVSGACWVVDGAQSRSNI